MNYIELRLDREQLALIKTALLKQDLREREVALDLKTKPNTSYSSLLLTLQLLEMAQLHEVK